jgi:hypothetical protein
MSIADAIIPQERVFTREVAVSHSGVVYGCFVGPSGETFGFYRKNGGVTEKIQPAAIPEHAKAMLLDTMDGRLPLRY